MVNKSSRSYSIDFIKGIAALSIVCLHCANNDAFDSILHLVGRLAVPMFFIITGYYLPSMIKTGHIPKHIVKILKIILGGLLFYLPLICIEAYFRGNLLWQLTHVIEWDMLLDKLVRAQYPFNVEAGHLWYLIAILYILCFLYFYSKKHKISKLYFLIPILFLIGYIISSIVDQYDSRMRSYYQNFLFTGMPYVLLGHLIHEKTEHKQFDNKLLGKLIVLCAVLYIAEIGFYVFIGLPPHREHYLFIIPLVSLILIWASQNSQFGKNNIITTIGRDYSICIYVVHRYFVINSYGLTGSPIIDSKLQMLISLGLSLLVAYLFVSIKKRLKKQKV
jgi:surface polysaccharide O-acyltransferase-like enzyme